MTTAVTAVKRSIASGMGLIAIATLSMFVVGCGNKSATPADGGVTDVTAGPSSSGSAYSPPSQTSIAAQPITYDTMPPTGGNNAYAAGGSISSGPYTVKRGDTLYSIARKSYGDGKQWQRIASANPGVRPETLKVGQTITIP